MNFPGTLRLDACVFGFGSAHFDVTFIVQYHDHVKKVCVIETPASLPGLDFATLRAMANLGSCHIVPAVDMTHTRHYSFYIPLSGRTILSPPRLRPLSAKTWPRGLSARHISSSCDPENIQLPTKSSNHLALSLGAALLAGLAGYNLGAQTRSTSSDTTQIYGDAQAVLRAKRELEASNLSVLDDPRTLESYGTSANSHHPASRHSLVVKVHGTEDVIKVVNVARKHRIPVTPYSGGTSLEGHFAGVWIYQ
jgi:hypothetical protein